MIGPYVGSDGELALAAWAEPRGGERGLVVAVIDASGVPSAPTPVGNVAAELDLVLVRGFGAASAKLVGKPRFALVTTRRTAQKTDLQVSAISASGAPLWGPATLAERSSRVLWVGFVVAGSTPLVLWAEQAATSKPGEAATIFALPVSSDGKQPEPALVVSKACAWQVASAGKQAALASVKPLGGSCTSGSVALDLLAESGKSQKSLELGGRAALDLDLVGSGDLFALAWSDQGSLEPRVMSALVDANGTLRAPAAPAIPSLGEQAAIALTPGPSPSIPAFLIWEDMATHADAARYFEISALDGTGRAKGAHARLLYARADGSTPELVPHAGGIAALTLAPACSKSSACDDVAPVPTFVALDASLTVQTSRPLLLAPLGGHAADLGWGLTCARGGCFALAAPSRSPAALFAVPLPVGATPYRPAAELAGLPSKPRVVSSDVLARAESPLAQLAVSEPGSPPLVGYVTDFDPTTPWQKLSKPAEDGRLEPLRARVAVRALGADGAPAGEEQVISLRAHSLGGLSLLSGGAKDQLALWTGLDKGLPQVFLSLLGEGGKRLQQRMLTHKLGDASDVAGLALDGGYLLAWVDQRSGDAEVYAARVARSLEKASPEQRITTASGAAAELSVTSLYGKPYAVWSDARAAQEPGWADIYAAFLRPSDAAREGNEHRLTNTRQHSFAPHVSVLGGVPTLAWLEGAADGSPSSVRLTALSESGDPSGAVLVVPLEMGAPRAMGFECGASSCRVAVTIEAEGHGELYGFEWKPGATPRVSKLGALGAPAAAGVAPLVRGDRIYVADLRDGRGLLRRLGVEW